MDNEEYERIATEYADVVYRVALSYAKSQHDAEDVLQITFLRLLTAKVEFLDEEHIRRWLIRVAVNESNRLWSSFWRRNVDYVQSDEDAGGKFSRAVSAWEPEFSCVENLDLYRALQQLPSKCRIVVHLFYYEGYSSKEIAAVLHIREATVRTRLVRARKLLKQQLKEAWENDE